MLMHEKNSSRINSDVSSIINWREKMLKLDDELFFDLMRLYLIDIKTPFSKTKLIESLSAFLRKPKTQSAIYKRISSDDKKIITAIKVLSPATKEKLSAFFWEDFSEEKIYRKIACLQERLLVFYDDDYLELNPLLPFLKNCVEPKILFPSLFCDSKNLKNDFNFFNEVEKNEKSFILEKMDLIIGAILKILTEETSILRQNYEIKKKASKIITEKIQCFNELNFLENDYSDCVVFFVLGIINLKLLTEENEKLFTNKNLVKKFSSLSSSDRILYLLVASSFETEVNLSLDKVGVIVCFVFQFLKIIFETGCEKKDLFKVFYFLKEKMIRLDKTQIESLNVIPKVSRLSQVLQNQNTSTIEENNSSKPFEYLKSLSYEAFQKIIKNAFKLNILVNKNTSENKEKISVSVAWKNILEQQKNRTAQMNTSIGSVLIDATSAVTIFPSIEFSDYISLLPFLEVQTIQTAGIFNLTKKSCQQAFSNGYSAEECCELLKKFSGHELPQSLSFSIFSWYKSWQGAIVYTGVVLCLEENRATIAEKNPAFLSLCKKKLSSGVFLMNAESQTELADTLEDLGISVSCFYDSSLKKRSERFYKSEGDFFSSYNISDFSFVANLKNSSVDVEVQPDFLANNTESESLSNDDFLQQLQKLDLNEDLKTAFSARINRNVILFPEQLDSRAIRFQKLEANAMDFSGKQHLLRESIAKHALLEISYLATDGTKSIKLHTSGFALRLGKDNVVCLKNNSDEEITEIPLAQVTYMKMIPNSIFY